jgi:hypothetical protein
MNRRVRVVAIVLLVAAATGFALHGLRAGGPVYQGRTTADWVRKALADQSRSEAFEAVLKIGAPAAPYLARQGLHDLCHRFPSLSSDRVMIFREAHPRLGRWLRLDRWENCAIRHDQARWILWCMGTNGQAVIPDVIDCLEHCPNQHFVNAMDLLDTLGEVSGTNPAAIPYLTKCARRNDSLCLRAAAMAYYINGLTNLLVETCQRLARKNPSDLLSGQELFWFRDDHGLNEHIVPLLEELYADPRATAGDRESAMFELTSRSNDATAAIARLLARQTNGLVPAQ